MGGAPTRARLDDEGRPRRARALVGRLWVGADQSDSSRSTVFASAHSGNRAALVWRVTEMGMLSPFSRWFVGLVAIIPEMEMCSKYSLG